jgi:hypothetical protein
MTMKINVQLTITKECYILCRLFQCSIADVLVFYMAKSLKEKKGLRDKEVRT